jgi:hypothetical protein
MASVIDLLTRYHLSGARDPGENRLTAALAAMLEVDESRDLARALVAPLLEAVKSAHQVAVWCQRPVDLGTDGRGFVDLELSFDSRYVVWIEAKIHSRESGPDQLSKYRTALERLAPDAWALIVLAPARRRREFPDDVPGQHFVSWQSVSARLLDWRASHADHETWLADQVLDHMKGLHLMEQALEPQHVDALKVANEAEDALTLLLDAVGHAVEPKQHGVLSGGKIVGGYVERVLNGPSPQVAWGVDIPNDVFFAGLRYERARPPGEILRWEASVDWQHDTSDATYGWWYTTLGVDEVTQLPSTRAQIEAVSTFVLEAMRTASDQL